VARAGVLGALLCLRCRGGAEAAGSGRDGGDPGKLAVHEAPGDAGSTTHARPQDAGRPAEPGSPGGRSTGRAAPDACGHALAPR
jgi:hypothetical protein